MELKIVSQTKNPFFERDEIMFEAKSDKSTPSRKEVKNTLVALTNSQDNKVIIMEIKNNFGSKAFSGKAFVYKNEEKLKEMHKYFARKRDSIVSEDETKKHDAAKAAKKAPKEKK